MALSDLIRKVEDSSRSTKVAVVASGIAVVAVGVAVFTVLNQSDSNSEPASPVVRVAAAPTATFSAPSPTPRPTPAPTSTSAPTSAPTSTPQPTPLPTETPLPTATATPDVSDYFVILYQGDISGDDIGFVAFYADYPFEKYKLEGANLAFYNEGFYLDYLVKEKVITSKQRDDYFNGEPIQKIPLVPISTATWKLSKKDPYNFSELRIRAPELLTHYADKSKFSLDSDEGVVDEVSLEDGGGYVTINDGDVSVSAVGADGNTTTVSVRGVGVEDLLEYWLSENKITIEQRNQYGETGQLEFSLKDGIDLFDFDYSSDVEFYTDMDKEAQDMIINEILPLFAGD